MTSHLTAFADGLMMGTLAQAKGGQLTFSYSEEWLNSAAAYPLSISMPLAPDQYGHRKIEPFLWGLLHLQTRPIGIPKEAYRHFHEAKQDFRGSPALPARPNIPRLHGAVSTFGCLANGTILILGGNT